MAPAGSESAPPTMAVAVKKAPHAVDEWNPPPAYSTAVGGGGRYRRRSTRSRSRASRQRSNLLRSMEVNNDDEDNDGEPLTIELVAAGVDRIALVGCQAALNFTRLILPRCNIRNIFIVTQFPYLQELDLSFNKIDDITPLRDMRYLTALNFENNHIRQIHFLTLSPSLTSFRRLNFADNSIARLPQFAGYLSLLSLTMRGNELVNLDGLASTRYLRYLDVSDNHIRSLDELDGAEHLDYLDVSGNRVKKFGHNISRMKQLKTLKIAHNRLEDLQGLEDLTNLHLLDASYNRIQQLESLLHLQPVRFLTHLDLSGNPVCRREAFIPMAYYLYSNLTRLNGKPCADTQWLEAKEMFLVNPLIRGVRDHFRDVAMKIASFQFNNTQQHQLHQTTTHADNKAAGAETQQQHTFTIVFLMGPPGGGRETLAHRLSTQCPHLVRLVRTVTARIDSVAALPEILLPRNDYVYELVSEKAFRSLVRNNQLLLSYGRRGCLYGIRESDVDDAARQNLAVVACIDTTGVTDLIGSNVRPTTFYVYPFTPSIMRARVEECGYDDVNTKRVLSSLHYSETLREKFPEFFHGKIDSDDIDKAYAALLEKLENVSGLQISDPPGGWKWSSNTQQLAAAAAAFANEQQESAATSLSTFNAQQMTQPPPDRNNSEDRKRLGKHTMASIMNMPQTRSDVTFDKELENARKNLGLLLPAMLPHHLRNSFLFAEDSSEQNNTDNTTRVNFLNSQQQQNSGAVEAVQCAGSVSGRSSSDENFGQIYFKKTKNCENNDNSNKLHVPSQLLTNPSGEFEASWERRMEKSMMDEIQQPDGMFDVDFDEEMQKFAEPGAARWLPEQREKQKRSSKTRSGKMNKDSAPPLECAQQKEISQSPYSLPQLPVPTVTTDDTPYTQSIDMTTAITARPDLIFDGCTADSALFETLSQRRRAADSAQDAAEERCAKGKRVKSPAHIIPLGRDIPLQMLSRRAQRQLNRVDIEIKQAVQRDVNMRRESPTLEIKALQQLPALRLPYAALPDDSDDEEQQQYQTRQKMMSKMLIHNAGGDAETCPLHGGGCGAAPQSSNGRRYSGQHGPATNDASRKFDTYREWITAWRRAVHSSQVQRKRVRDQQHRRQLQNSDKPSPVALAAMMGNGKKKNTEEEQNTNRTEISHLDGIEVAGALPRQKQDVFSLERQQQFLARQTNFPPLACRDLACVHPERTVNSVTSQPAIQQQVHRKKPQQQKQQRFDKEENVAHNNTAIS